VAERACTAQGLKSKKKIKNEKKNVAERTLSAQPKVEKSSEKSFGQWLCVVNVRVLFVVNVFMR
jgi:hypothetical protein